MTYGVISFTAQEIEGLSKAILTTLKLLQKYAKTIEEGKSHKDHDHTAPPIILAYQIQPDLIMEISSLYVSFYTI